MEQNSNQSLINIAVFGSISSGKSSFLNWLLSFVLLDKIFQILPVQHSENTHWILEISSSKFQQKSNSIILKENNQIIYEFNDYKTLAETLKHLEKQYEKAFNPASPKQLQLFLPFKQEYSNFKLIDLPTYSISSKYLLDKTTNENCHLVWLKSMDEPVPSNQEIEDFLAKFTFSGAPRYIHVVWNKIDKFQKNMLEDLQEADNQTEKYKQGFTE